MSRNIEEILGLGIKDDERDWVVWEGDPLQYGAGVVLIVERGAGAGAGAVREAGRIVGCWPESL